MATAFDEVLLDTGYSADQAEGGPEFATAVIGGGSALLEQRTRVREQYLSKFDLSWGEMSAAQWKAFRSFAICRKGMARGFRLLAPDDRSLSFDILALPDGDSFAVMGWSDGTPDEFYPIKFYWDAVNTPRIKRLVKISPYVASTLYVFHQSDPNTLVASVTFQAVGSSNPIPETIEEDLSFGSFDGQATVHLFTGTITLTSPLPSGYRLHYSCEYHPPVAFTDDWFRFEKDEEGYPAVRIGVQELLPAEIGLV